MEVPPPYAPTTYSGGSLKKAFLRDSIDHNEYTPTCLRLIAQYNAMLKNEAVNKEFGSLEKFKDRFGLEYVLGIERLKVGIPVTFGETVSTANTAIQTQVSDIDFNKNSGNDLSGGKMKGGAKSIAEITGNFITCMDAVRLKYRAKDQLHPLLSELVTSLNRITIDGKDFTGKGTLVQWLITLNGLKVDEEITDEQALTFVAIILNCYIYQYYRFKPSSCYWKDDKDLVRLVAFGDPQIRGVNSASSLRTKIDIWGNDYYLAHIYKVLVQFLEPTHVSIMGDLISSQWISNKEFYEREQRFSKKIFRKDILLKNTHFFNICGNHDIGYAGEMTKERVDRFEKLYGSVNFVNYYPEGYRIVVLNSLAIDGPGWENIYYDQTLKFLHSLKKEEYKGPTILLTHVPMYKESGICKDGPLFNYYGSEYRNVLKEQNQLSQESTKMVLECVFNLEYGGVILTGHDHDGCVIEYEHNKTEWIIINSKSGYRVTKSTIIGPKILEATVRSMMGEFGGNAGLLSASIDQKNQWMFNYRLCPFHVQHLWWATQVITIFSAILIATFFVFRKLK